MMSQLACLGNSSPGPAQVSQDLEQTQSRQDDMRRSDEQPKGKKRVRFKNQPLTDKPVGPSSLEEDVELYIEQF